MTVEGGALIKQQGPSKAPTQSLRYRAGAHPHFPHLHAPAHRHRRTSAGRTPGRTGRGVAMARPAAAGRCSSR